MPKINEIELSSVDEFDFRLLIKALGKGEKGSRSLTFDEASLLIEGFAANKVTKAQMASAMMLMRVRNETVEEVAGVVAGLKKATSDEWSALEIDIDWPVYAGKREQLPWLLLVAKLFGQLGYKIMLHGDSLALPHRRHVESCIHALNIPCCTSASEAKQALTTSPVIYVPSGAINPVLDKCRELHQELGLRSLIQTAVRCINPSNAAISLRSFFHPGLDRLHQDVAELLISHDVYQPGRIAIFKGLQGETEINPRVTTEVCIIQHRQPLECPKIVQRSINTLLEGFSGAKVGQADLQAHALVSLWQTSSHTENGELGQLMTQAMIEQAQKSIEATLVLLLQVINLDCETLQVEAHAKQLWCDRMSLKDEPKAKEWLCAI